MDKKLKSFMDSVSPDESEFLEKSLDRTAKKAKITKDKQARILAATMRKAGFEMSEAQAKITMRKKKIKKIMICGIAAAAALLSAVGWTRANPDVFMRVQGFFHQDISPYETEIMKHAQTVENDDIKLSIDGVVADEVKCSVVFTLTSKSERGEKLLEQLNYGSNMVIAKEVRYCKRAELLERIGLLSEDEVRDWVQNKIDELPPHKYTIYFENAGKKAFDTSDRNTIFGNIDDDNSITKDMFGNVYSMYSPNNSKHHHYERFDFEMRELDLSQPLVIHEFETGLSTEIDLSEYIDSHRLVSDDPDAFDYTVISPLAIYIRSTEHDRECGRALSDGGYMGDEEYTKVVINYKDGTSEEVFGSVGMTQEFLDEDIPDHDTEKEAYDEYMTEHWHENITDQSLETYCDHLLDLEKIESVSIDGVIYTIE